jgi:transposase
MTSKFADYLPLYRLEDIFERQGFEISRATQSVWCGDVADVVEPLYQRMAERVRKSHVVATDDTIFPMLSPGQTQSARMPPTVQREVEHVVRMSLIAHIHPQRGRKSF